MADTISQANRWLTLDTPLGTDKLLATEVYGTEAISEVFEFHVSALSPEMRINPSDILGKSATLSMAHPKGNRRFVNGIVTSIAAGFTTRNKYRLYSLVISPTLWTLGRTSDYKVFQKKSVPDILGELLTGVPYKKSLSGKYEKRDFCTQFGETDLDFFHRLIADDGIFYYFEHTDSAHTLVLCDSATAYKDAAQKEIEYWQDVDDVTDAVSVLDFASNLTETSWTLSDYDYEKSTTLYEKTTKTALQPAKDKNWEQFRYGDGPHMDRVNMLSPAAVDATDAGFEVITGKGSAASFTPGYRFTITKHPDSEAVNSKLVLTRVRHEARDQTYFTVRPETEGKPYYHNEFSCIPADRIARQPLPPPKPVVQGPQTAIVVGGDEGEIKTDEYGRIQVRFHWDREGKKNDNASCLVRVSQPLAGSGWGGWFIPRVGMEVVVHFLDGDPDRPLVTGAVYNAEYQGPWEESKRATKSGFYTLSVKSTSKSTAHEISVDEEQGKELMTIHAEKDFLREVENDDTLDVGNDQTRTIKNNRSTTISEGNDALTVSKGNQTVEISEGNQTTTVSKGDQTTTISQGDQKTTISQGDQTTTISQGDQTIKISSGNQVVNASEVTVSAMQKITLKCGSNSLEISQQGITINGMTIKLTGTSSLDASAAMITISADGVANLKGGIVNIN